MKLAAVVTFSPSETERAMPSQSPVAAVAGALSLVFAGSADSQAGHHDKAARADTTQQTMNCDMVAASPQGGMDKGACEAMNRAAASYDSARSDPSAARPGDEAMTCTQLEAEFMAQGPATPDARNVAALQASSSEMMRDAAKYQAQAAALAAEGAAAETAASAVGVANPVAGAMASQAVQKGMDVQERALQAKAEAEMRPVARRNMAAAGAVAGDAGAQMQGNPRLARLMSLMQEKNCH